MLIGHSMDIVSIPKVPGLRTKFVKIRCMQAVDNIPVLLGHIMQFFRKWAWLHNLSDLMKIAENMQPKSDESGYKFIALTNYDKC